MWTIIYGSDSICVCATVPDFCLHSCTYNTLILAVYEFAFVHLVAGDICKWSYICNTFGWIIEMIIFFFFSAADPPAWVKVRLLCPADLVFCSRFIHLQDYLVAPNVQLLCLVFIFLMRLSNSWMLLLNHFKKSFSSQVLDFLVQALDYVL